MANEIPRSLQSVAAGTPAPERPTVPPRDRRGLRTGFTTGACAAAAARAATRFLLRGETVTEIEITLPNRQRATFPVYRCERQGDRGFCSVIKDAGDDPDCTHGAELVAEVRLRDEPGIVLDGGEGVARVTKPGLGLAVGRAAINAMPRANITQMVMKELADSERQGAEVTIHVPGGEIMAQKTTNARLGLLGGISILGTTGIVKPYSTAAYRASIVQAIDMARECGLPELVFTTGGRSESYAMQMFPQLPEDAFIQMGDFVGTAMKHAVRRGTAQVRVVAMMGKLSKIADGRMQTHAAGSEVNMELLSTLAAELGASADLCAELRQANTARHVLEICRNAYLEGLTGIVCRQAAAQIQKHVGSAFRLSIHMVDFGGGVLAQFPDETATGVDRRD